MSRTPVLDALAGLVRPPFRGLLALIFALFALAFLLHPGSPLLCGTFLDTDDPMYLAHMLDWVKGQSWFDTAQHRLAPPFGTQLHFTRIPEIPLALFTLLGHAYGFAWRESALIASAIDPLLLFAFLLLALRSFTGLFVAQDWARISAVVVFFMPELLLEYAPGRVDHHGLCALLVLLALGALIRYLRAPGAARLAAIPAALFALALAVALETLPWLLIGSLAVGATLIQRGEKAARGAVVYALTLYLTTLVLLFGLYGSAAFAKADPLVYSATYALLTGAIALTFVASALFTSIRSPLRRAFVLGVIAVFFGGVFLSLNGQLIFGPYGAMDPRLAALFFNSINETKPLLAMGTLSWSVLLPLIPIMIAIVFSLMRLFGESAEQKRTYAILFAFLAAAFLLTGFYQRRYIYYALLFSVVPLTDLFHVGLNAARLRWRGRRLFAAEIGLFLLVGPLFSVLGPALFDGRAFNTGVLLFPVHISAFERCGEQRGLTEILTTREILGDRAHVIMNTINDGASLLFRTDHEVLAAPYHTDVEGNLASLYFFTATDPELAHKILLEQGADLVLLNRRLPNFYLQAATPGSAKTPTMETTMAALLLAGSAPAWLKRVDLPFLGDYLLYRTN